MPVKLRSLLAVALFCSVAVSVAQSVGPSPLAWRWSQNTTVSPGGSIAANNDVIYAAVGQRVYAIDRDSGNQRWRFPAAAPLDANFRTGCVFGDDTVVAAADNKTIFGINAADGTVKWTYEGTVGLIGAPVLVGKYVVFAQSDNSLMALYASNGQAAWLAPQRVFDGIQGFISGYLDNVIFATARQELWSVNVGTQNKNWSKRFSILPGDSRPTVFGDSVYVNSGTFVTALSAIDGSRRWEADANMALLRNPAASSSGVAVLSREGNLMTFDASGRKLLKDPIVLGSPPMVDPLYTGSLVLAATQNGFLHMVDSKTGEVRWNFQVKPVVKAKAPASGTTGGTTDKPPTFVQAASTPMLLGQTVLLTARDGSILAFDRQNGVDVTPPEVKMVFPAPGDQVKGKPPFEIFFTVTDESSGVNSKALSIDVDGTKIETTTNRDGFIVARFSNETKNRPLRDGRRVITVKATDWLGNSVSKSFLLVIDSTLPDTRPRAGAGAGAGGGSRQGGGGGGRDGL